MSNIIPIIGLDKAALLAAIYNSATYFGTSNLAEGYDVNDVMTTDQAATLISSMTAAPQMTSRSMVLYFDYYKGRYMKVNLSGDMVDPYMYDKQYGTGALLALVSGL